MNLWNSIIDFIVLLLFKLSQGLKAIRTALTGDR